jgi:hypothetical protein
MTLKACHRDGVVKRKRAVPKQLGGKNDEKCVQGGKEVRKIILRKCERADNIVHDFNGCKRIKYSTQ